MTKNLKLPSRCLKINDFEKTYQKVILSNQFFETDAYYAQNKFRYFNSLQAICKLPIPKPARILEVSGGQLALLSQELFGDICTVVDVNETYKSSITNFGIQFQCCDLLHDDLSEKAVYDLVIICEAIEHLPIPPYIVIEKIKAWLKPSGLIFLTTPNLYRLRNLVRLALGLKVFDTFLIPEKGQGIGHPLEYSKSHLKWQLEKAGFESVKIELKQLNNIGSTRLTQLGRIVAIPFLLRPLWRDSLVAVAQKPAVA